MRKLAISLVVSMVMVSMVVPMADARAPIARDMASLRYDSVNAGHDEEKIIHVDRYIIDWDQHDEDGVPLSNNISEVINDGIFNPRKDSVGIDVNIADATFSTAAGVEWATVTIDDGDHQTSKGFQIKSSSFLFMAPMLDSWMGPSNWEAFSDYCILMPVDSTETRVPTIKDPGLKNWGTGDWTVAISTGRGDTVTFYDPANPHSTLLTPARIAEVAGGPMISWDPIEIQNSDTGATPSVSWGGLTAAVAADGTLTLTTDDGTEFEQYRRVTVRKEAVSVDDWDAYDLIIGEAVQATAFDPREPTDSVILGFEENFNFESISVDQLLGTWATGLDPDTEFWTEAGSGDPGYPGGQKTTPGVVEAGDNLRHYRNQQTMWHVFPPGANVVTGNWPPAAFQARKPAKIAIKPAELPGSWAGATDGNALHIYINERPEGLTLNSRPIGRDAVTPGGFLRLEFNMAVISDAQLDDLGFPEVAAVLKSEPAYAINAVNMISGIHTDANSFSKDGGNEAARKFENPLYSHYGKWRKHVVGFRVPEFGHNTEMAGVARNLVSGFGWSVGIVVGFPNFAQPYDATHTIIIDNVRLTAMNAPLMDFAIGAAEVPMLYAGANPFATFGKAEPFPEYENSDKYPWIADANYHEFFPVALHGINGVQYEKGQPISGNFDVNNVQTAVDVDFTNTVDIPMHPANVDYDAVNNPGAYLAASKGLNQIGWLGQYYLDFRMWSQKTNNPWPMPADHDNDWYTGYTVLVSDAQHVMPFPGPSAAEGGIDLSVRLSRRDAGTQTVANFKRQSTATNDATGAATWKEYRSAIRAGYLDIDAAEEALRTAMGSTTPRQENAPGALKWRGEANGGKIAGALVGMKFYLQSTAADHRDNPTLNLAIQSADLGSGMIVQIVGPALTDLEQSGNSNLWQEIYFEGTMHHMASPDAQDRMDAATAQPRGWPDDPRATYHGGIDDPNLNLIQIEIASMAQLAYHDNTISRHWRRYRQYEPRPGDVYDFGPEPTFNDLPTRYSGAWIYVDNVTLYMAQELPEYYNYKTIP